MSSLTLLTMPINPNPQPIAAEVRGERCRLHPRSDHDWACCPEKGIQTSRDQAWKFQWKPYKAKQPIEITSKGQFLRECKQRGLRWVGKDDVLKGGRPYSPPAKGIDDKKFEEAVSQIIPATKAMRRKHAKV